MTEPEETYEPQSVELIEGAMLISDEFEFFELTKSIAVRMWEGSVQVLDAETLKWRDPAPPKPATVSSVKTAK